MKLKDTETGKEYEAQPAAGLELYTLRPLVSDFTCRVKRWADAQGYPNANRKVRLITRTPGGRYDSFETMPIEQIHSDFPRRKVVGLFDKCGIYRAAPQA